MKLLTYIQDEQQLVGALLDDATVLEVKAAADAFASPRKVDASSLKTFVEQGDDAVQTVRILLDEAREYRKSWEDWGFLFPLASLKLVAPIPNPSKVVAIGQNYIDHCREQNAPIPERPIIFAKFPTSVIGHGDAITWPPDLTKEVDYEAELGVVIGKRARCVRKEDAFDYVAGYLNANDVSARDLQFGEKQWVRGKSLDTFCPLGPYLVTKDEIPDPHNLRIRATLNGNVMQDSNTSNLIFRIPELIEFASAAFTLLPGDILLTGTPPGVGVFRAPKVLMQPGDTITIEVEGLGALTNPVAAWNNQ